MYNSCLFSRMPLLRPRPFHFVLFCPGGAADSSAESSCGAVAPLGTTAVDKRVLWKWPWSSLRWEQVLLVVHPNYTPRCTPLGMTLKAYLISPGRALPLARSWFRCGGYFTLSWPEEQGTSNGIALGKRFFSDLWRWARVDCRFLPVHRPVQERPTQISHCHVSMRQWGGSKTKWKSQRPQSRKMEGTWALNGSEWPNKPALLSPCHQLSVTWESEISSSFLVTCSSSVTCSWKGFWNKTVQLKSRS